MDDEVVGDDNADDNGPNNGRFNHPGSSRLINRLIILVRAEIWTRGVMWIPWSHDSGKKA